MHRENLQIQNWLTQTARPWEAKPLLAKNQAAICGFISVSGHIRGSYIPASDSKIDPPTCLQVIYLLHWNQPVPSQSWHYYNLCWVVLLLHNWLCCKKNGLSLLRSYWSYTQGLINKQGIHFYSKTENLLMANFCFWVICHVFVFFLSFSFSLLHGLQRLANLHGRFSNCFTPMPILMEPGLESAASGLRLRPQHWLPIYSRCNVFCAA